MESKANTVQGMDGRKRPIVLLPLELHIPWAPPSVNVWQRMNHWKRKDMKDTAYLAVVCAVVEAGVQGMSVPTPCDIHVTIEKTGYTREYDPQNFVTPVDKLFLDALTQVKGRKRRGLGLLPDDSVDHIRLFSPTVEWGHKKSRTILWFRPSPKGAVHENQKNQNDQPPARKNPRRHPQGKA